jgi:hypothetical protein
VSEVKEIIDRLRLKFPVRVTARDVFTGESYEISRENVIALLVPDLSNLATVAAFYAEMARAHAALKSVAAEKQAELKRWKAQMRAECRRKAEQAKEKPPSKDLQDDYYRTHDDYMRVNRAADDSRVIMELFGDLKAAFEKKQFALRDLHGVTFGHDRVTARAASVRWSRRAR